MDLFDKVKNGFPFAIQNRYGANFLMAACNPYEKKWKNEKGVVFHSPYWYENIYSKAVFFVPGELKEVGKDEYELTSVEIDGELNVSRIFRVYPNHELWPDWVSYLKYKKVNPEENNENALGNIKYRIESEEEFDKAYANIKNKNQEGN